MKIRYIAYLFVVSFVFAALSVFAQATNAVPVVDPAVIPSSVSSYWDFAIAALAPLIVNGIKKIAPKVPKWVLPASTPIIGILLGMAMSFFNVHHYSWFDAAKAGMLAVMIRETWNQTVTRYFSTDSGDAAQPAPPSTK